jgi:hypothetical protein
MSGWRFIPCCGRLERLKTRNHPCPSLERRGAGTEAYRCLKAFGGHLFLMRLQFEDCEGNIKIILDHSSTFSVINRPEYP